ncbi:MAG: OsmC family protein [Myxococcaceae bacterium]|nr:OsmC family protein [Myxococcaceae bacterium]
MQPRHDKTFRYDTSLEWQSRRRATAMLEAAPPLALAPPRDFGGEPGRWAPEQLLLSAVESCTLFTFLAEAARQNLELVSWGSSAEGTVTRDRDGRFSFTSVVVRPVVEVKTDDDALTARALLQTVGRHCFIGNSLKAEPRIEGRVVVGGFAREPATPEPAVEGPSS